MTGWCGPKREWRLACAVVVLLAALVHVLVCAHGPLSGTGPTADSLPAAAAHCPGPATPHDGTGHQATCESADQPATAHQQQDAPRAFDTSAPAPETAGPGSVPVLRRADTEPGPATGGHTRASLGIWRT
ncbi:hypothetical protein [Kitasatospora cineracea]|uniref:Uncharacterized protein n=1 Tax=Kitasatospora cineracea TaxID=88074 RepID=A0A8G1UH99_9ACTN|nr:hypothetical protein [Kitasatospora cineracea]ROR43019.1 hypothetical protein EDD39_1154 [Kitasatospora cineracea]